MTISIDLGQQKLFVTVMNQYTPQNCFTLETGVERGKITNPTETAAALTKALKEKGIKAKTCIFVLPSTAVLLKEMAVPFLKRESLLQLVRTNFSSFTEAGGEFAVDYIPMEKGENSTLMGVLIKKQFLTQCTTLAKLAGLRCTRIDIHPSAILRYRNIFGKGIEKPEILVHMSSNLAEIILIDRNTIFTRMVELTEETPQDNLLKNWAMSVNDSLLSDQDDNHKRRTVVEQIRSISRFQLSRDGQRPVEIVSLYGEVEEELYREVEDVVDGVVMPLSSEKEQLPYLNAIGASRGGKSSFNLLDSLKQHSGSQIKASRLKLVMISIMALVLAAEVGAGLAVWQENERLKSEIKASDDYLNAPETKEDLRYAQYNQILYEEQRLYNNTLAYYQEQFEQEYRIGSKKVNAIYDQAAGYEVTIFYYEYKEGDLVLRCNAPDSTVAAEFAKSLQQQGIADEVSFAGYALEVGVVSPGYRFEVKAALREEAME